MICQISEIFIMYSGVASRVIVKPHPPHLPLYSKQHLKQNNCGHWTIFQIPTTTDWLNLSH